MPGKKKFPDLTGDGKVTKKDILKARGVPGFREGGGVKSIKATKKKKKEEKELSIDPLKLANPKKKIKPFLSPEPIGEGKQLPLKKASGGMARRDKDEEKALKGIEKQQKSQAKRAEQAHRDVREYVRKKARTKKANGGMVLEIGLRPATKSEMKMAKEMKKPVKKANGGMVRGTGSAIRGTKFKGVF